MKSLFIILLSLLSVTASGKNDLTTLSDSLDYMIANKHKFVKLKEQKINNLKSLLNEKGASLQYEYEINLKLYNEYRKFKLDSAIYYIKRNVQIANYLQDAKLGYTSEINLATLYSYTGKYRESEEILKNLKASQLPKDMLPDYYTAHIMFFSNYGVMSSQPEYGEQAQIYQDSLLAVSDTSSFNFKINTIPTLINRGEIDRAEKMLFGLLKTEESQTPNYSVITHYLGVVYNIKKEPALEKKYHILSAMGDIRYSTKENTSFQKLALISYNEGDIERAFEYTQSAIEDAVSAGVQFRTTQMSQFYSIINASYQAKEAAAKRQLKTYLILISILLLVFIVLILYIYRQMRKVSRIKEELSRAGGKLTELNTELNISNELLNDRNSQLQESNHMKEEYIAQFFYWCSAYINQLEDYQKTLYKLGINRQYEELIKKLKSTTVVDNELEELYSHFDSVFLSLYPTFVADFNSLLASDEQITLKTGDILNKELRIYALLRLGITDNVKIASFLRCSMSTIYNYRTRMRNKTIVDRNEFENRVMKIGFAGRVDN